MRSPAELIEAFRARGLNVTPQRQVIFRILHGNDRHPTAEAVHDAAVAEMPAISLRTVYQTLNDLSAMGEIQTLELGTGSARFDPHVPPTTTISSASTAAALETSWSRVSRRSSPRTTCRASRSPPGSSSTGARARLAASAREEGARPAPQRTADNQKEQPRCRI